MLKKMLYDNYENIKNENNLEEKALKLVSILYEGKIDKVGKNYIEHLIKVKNLIETNNQKVIALLHDIIENLNITEEELIEIGFPKYIVDVVSMLSRKNNPKEDYDDYIERIINSKNIDACIVKLADLCHNMDISRIDNPTIKDFSRIEKRYRPNYIKIQNKLKEMKI